VKDKLTSCSNDNREVRLPAARGRALTRGLLWIVPATVSGASAFVVYADLRFGSSGASSALVDVSVALAALPLPIIALVCAVYAVRWFALATWPGWVGVVADDDRLMLRLGPFGGACYDAGRIEARYLFEVSADDVDEPYEAFLPEAEQMARLIPMLTHPDAPAPVRRTLLRFVVGDEASIAAALRPVIERWRSRRIA